MAILGQRKLRGNGIQLRGDFGDCDFYMINFSKGVNYYLSHIKGVSVFLIEFCSSQLKLSTLSVVM